MNVAPLRASALGLLLVAALAACATSRPPARDAAGAQPTTGAKGERPAAGSSAAAASGTSAVSLTPPAPDGDGGRDTATTHGEPSTGDDSNARFRVPLGASPSRGAATALVTIVEFADYQCPFCASVEETLRDLRARYGDALRIVHKDAPLPFHPMAEPAAEAAREVRAERGDAAFWQMHDALFAHQGHLEAGEIVRLAEAAGARGDKVRAAMDKHLYAEEIETDEDVADDFGAEGTPYFFVDGRPLVGAEPEAQFVAVIDEELKLAKSAVAAGAPQTAVYDWLVKKGHGPPEPERRDVQALPAGDPARGAPVARVTVHEFADFQCPFCVRAEAVVRAAAKAYGDRVRFVWHDLPLPFHDHALLAARAGREAQSQKGDATFWRLHDQLLSEGGVSRPALDADARALGLDLARWNAGLDGTAHDSAIEADRRAASALGIDGTPSFLIVPGGSTTGYLLVGAQGYSRFHKLIDRALAEAQ